MILFGACHVHSIPCDLCALWGSSLGLAMMQCPLILGEKVGALFGGEGGWLDGDGVMGANKG
jgi:hypothetical protein